MKHYVKPECKHKCRFLQIVDELWLCPHMAYGELSYRKGAVEQARAMLDKQGGYDAVLARLVEEEEQRREAARDKRESRNRRLADSVKYQ